jgi:DNA-binding response OmpR family regulator
MSSRPSVTGARLLVVDPDGDDELDAALAGAGMVVSRASTGADALVLFGRAAPDAVLLAPRLPDLCAAELVATLRRFGTHPVLLGIGADDTEVAGPAFVAGATAAVRRPFDAGDVAGRLAATLPPRAARGRLTFGPLRLDPRAHTVHLDDVELDRVPRKEFELLWLLMTHADQVVSAGQIRTWLWGHAGAASPNAIAVHAGRLRARLRPPVVVRTVRGLGYRLTLAG